MTRLKLTELLPFSSLLDSSLRHRKLVPLLPSLQDEVIAVKCSLHPSNLSHHRALRFT